MPKNAGLALYTKNVDGTWISESDGSRLNYTNWSGAGNRKWAYLSQLYVDHYFVSILRLHFGEHIERLL